MVPVVHLLSARSGMCKPHASYIAAPVSSGAPQHDAGMRPAVYLLSSGPGSAETSVHPEFCFKSQFGCSSLHMQTLREQRLLVEGRHKASGPLVMKMEGMHACLVVQFCPPPFSS